MKIVHYSNPYTGVRRVEEIEGDVAKKHLTNPEVPVISSRDVHTLARICSFVGDKTSFVLTEADDQSEVFYLVALEASPLVSSKYFSREGYQSLCIESKGSPILTEELLKEVGRSISTDVDYKQVEVHMSFDRETGGFRILLRRVEPWVFASDPWVHK